VNTLVLASALVAAGLYGVLTRRDLIAVLAAVEVMLGGASVLLVAYSSAGTDAAAGQGYALMVLAVGAAEAAVGIALLISLVRRGRSRTDQITEVRG
jgi:NADH-quinone oxidoreductase subunit K